MSPSSDAVLAAFFSTTLISLAPNVLLVLFPRYASGEGSDSPLLSLGQALAAGGLLGDVFLHVLPHSFAGGGCGHHDHGGHNDDDEVGMWVLLGFTIFLVSDMTIRGLSASHHGHHSHDTKAKKGADPSDDDLQHSKPPAVDSNWTSTVLLNLAADALHNVSEQL
jgi:zinc transporter 7